MKTTLAGLTTALVMLAASVSPAAGAGSAGMVEPGVSREMIKSAIMPTTARLRGLAFKRNVPVEITTPAKVAAYVRKVLDKEIPEREFKGYEAVLRYIGFLEPGVDLKEILINVYAHNIGGYYDDEKKSFALVVQPGMPNALDAMTVSHELTHALQDQHFDLAGLRDFITHNDDAQMGVLSLAEGDACDIMLRYVEGSYPRGTGAVKDYSRLLSVMTTPQNIPAVPLIIAQDMVFPYTYGTRFVIAVLERKGAMGVNLAFGDPPVSTEQVINPEKYFLRDEPSIIELPDLTSVLPEGWSQLDEEPLGQFNLGIFLAVNLGTWGVDETIAPWDGDVMALYQGPQPQDLFFAYYSTWDTPAAAAEFLATCSRLVESRFGDLEIVTCEETLVTWTTAGRLFYLRRYGTDVLLVENVPTEMAGRVIMRLWDARKVPFGIARPIADRDRVQPDTP
ncbi:MAG: hypothetical protein J7M19_03915 [Planctomycetes bacterium]|nr:hypothetical protein [Planctomycetota bacterium]